MASLLVRPKSNSVRSRWSRRGLAWPRSRLNSARRELNCEDFNYLAKVFGPDEIQLCEIQAAGPEVSTLVNALLEGCFDNKFEIRFRTQRPKADGEGYGRRF